jgi:hypothetical protein
VKVTWIPDGIPQISTKSASTSKDLSPRDTKTCTIYQRGRNRFQVPAAKRRQLASRLRLLQISKQPYATRRVQIDVYHWPHTANRACDRLQGYAPPSVQYRPPAQQFHLPLVTMWMSDVSHLLPTCCAIKPSASNCLSYFSNRS